METNNVPTNTNTLEETAAPQNTSCKNGFSELKWIDGCSITFRMDGSSAILSANKAGLLSLASHLITLAEGKPGDHIHLDSYNSLEDGSDELIIEQIPGTRD